jgi:hypothetical protein
MRRLIIALIVLALAWSWVSKPDARYSQQLASMVDTRVAMSGLALDRPPRQIEIASARVLRVDDVDIRLRAEFGLEARVLARKDYRWDPWADLSPLDLALGWGPMSDPDVLSRIDIRQNGRFYFWRVDEFPIPRPQIEQSSANMHIIPSNPALLDRLARIEAGDRLRLMGYLVDVDRDDGAYWRTSMRRDDTGDGACELFLVTGVESL